MNIFQRKRTLIEANHKIALELASIKKDLENCYSILSWQADAHTRISEENNALKKQLWEQEKILNIRIVS